MSIAERAELNFNFEQDIKEIDELQAVFDSELKQSSTGRILSYNPVLERWKFEHIRSEIDEIKFRTHEEQQIKTTLRERLDTVRSIVSYKIIGSYAFNEHFPDEPFDKVLERGIAYRKSIGSTETKREKAELDGWTYVFENLTKPETPVNSKFIVISGPGFGKTAYPYNFVDIYEKVETPSGEIAVSMTRTASQTNYTGYHEAVLSIHPDYFKNFIGPLDGWYLGHPLLVRPEQVPMTPEAIFDSMFREKSVSMSNEEFEQILEACMPLILHYVDTLCQDSFNPREVAIAFNAVLNRADIEKEIINHQKRDEDFVRFYPSFRNVSEEAYFLGTIPVREIMAGCGLSGGTDIDLLNSVAGYAVNEEGPGWHFGVCIECHKVTRVGGCDICAMCVLLHYSNN